MPRSDEREKKLAIATAGGAAAGGAIPMVPTRLRIPTDPRSIEAGKEAASGEASVRNLRGAYRGMGERVGNDKHVAHLAQGIRRKGYDPKRPIQITRYKSGETLVTGGHHRIAAAEMVGLEKLPVQVKESSSKHPWTVVPLFQRGKYKRDVINSRNSPEKKLTDAEISAKASKKIGRVANTVNSVKSKVEESVQTVGKNPKVAVPAVAGTAAAGVGYVNRDKIKEALNKSAAEDKKLIRDKKIQADLSITGSMLGMSALGSKGIGVGMRRSAKTLNAMNNAAKAQRRVKNAGVWDKASLGLVTTGAGVGGISGLKFAQIQREEAKRIKKQLESPMANAFGVVHTYDISKAEAKHAAPKDNVTTRVAGTTKKTAGETAAALKAWGMRHPYASTAAIGGAIGLGVIAPGIMASESVSRTRARRLRRQYGFSKAKGFDPEERRKFREGVYATGLGAGAVGAGGLAAQQVMSSKLPKKQKALDKLERAARKNKQMNFTSAYPTRNAYRARDAAALKALKRGGPLAAGSLALGAGATGVALHSRNGGKKYNGWWNG